jgi:hypothetical protein
MPKRVARLTPLAWIQLRYSALLLMQLLVFLVYPFLIDGPAGIAIMGLFITGTMLAASFSLGDHARRLSLLLVVPTSAFIWTAIAGTSDLAL